jgi:paraquat-inducible protein B
LNVEPQDEPVARRFSYVKIIKQSRPVLVWVILLIAAVTSGWLIFKQVSELGPLIEIQFNNGSGLQANQTVVKYHGVRISEVRSVRLSGDTTHAEVQVRLNASAKNLARAGSQFWIVRPKVGAGGLHGLETIVSGPYIQVEPGYGSQQMKFIGVEDPPILKTAKGGLEIILTTPQIKALSIGSPVYYRGIEVGTVEYFVLNDNATKVQIHLLIKPAFSPLMRVETKFWNAGGISMRLKLSGINISVESFKSLIIGGIAFATPPSPGNMVSNGCIFQFNEKVEQKWLEWSPAIAVINASAAISDNPPASLLLDGADSDSKQ